MSRSPSLIGSASGEYRGWRSRATRSARQTGAPERTLYRQAARFETHGMASLFAAVPTRQHRLPDAIRQAIIQLKAE